MADQLTKNDIIRPFTINEKFLEKVLDAKWWKENLPMYKYNMDKVKPYFKTRV